MFLGMPWAKRRLHLAVVDFYDCLYLENHA